MNRKVAIIWSLAVMAVALLNILDVLPDWTTITAVLTLPFVASATGNGCCLRIGRGMAE